MATQWPLFLKQRGLTHNLQRPRRNRVKDLLIEQTPRGALFQALALHRRCKRLRNGSLVRISKVSHSAVISTKRALSDNESGLEGSVLLGSTAIQFSSLFVFEWTFRHALHVAFLCAFQIHRRAGRTNGYFYCLDSLRNGS